MKFPEIIKRVVLSLLGPMEPDITFGQYVADKFATIVGSWTFIIIQSIFLVIWLAINICAIALAWDPYPFILLNLFLSFQAAYTGPILLMAQNRQTEKDREVQRLDYELSKSNFEYLERTIKILQAYEKDRVYQFHLLKEILEEVEDDNVPEEPENRDA